MIQRLSAFIRIMRRLSAFSGVAALTASLITALGYLVATRHHGRFQRDFQDHWEIIGGMVALAIIGLLEMGYGLVLCFSVLGAFEEDNLRRGAGNLVLGALISALGAAVLWNVLSG